MPHTTDPISELADALRTDRKPPLEWVVRWSEGGREPVRAAWAHGRDGFRMMGLLRAVGRDETESLFRALVTRVVWWDPPFGGDPEEARVEIAARLAVAVRLGAPEPPALGELVAAYAGGVPWREGETGYEASMVRLERGEWPTSWIMFYAGDKEVPLRSEWSQMPLYDQVRVLAYVAPLELAQMLAPLHDAARARAAEARQDGDEKAATAMERYAAGTLACAELLRKGLEKDAADAFDRASSGTWSNAERDDMLEVVVAWNEDLMARFQPSLADLLAGLDRVRGRAR